MRQVHRRLIAATVVMSILLQGCAAAIVAGAATGAVIVHDRRTVGAFIDDAAIELKAKKNIANHKQLDSGVHINVTSMNGVVLISGEASTIELRDLVLTQVRSVEGVRRTVNEIRIGKPSPFSERRRDSWLTSKVKTRLITDSNVDSTRIKVITENANVYLMGLVTRKESEAATERVRSVNGIKRIVKLFEYID